MNIMCSIARQGLHGTGQASVPRIISVKVSLHWFEINVQRNFDSDEKSAPLIPPLSKTFGTCLKNFAHVKIRCLRKARICLFWILTHATRRSSSLSWTFLRYIILNLRWARTWFPSHNSRKCAYACINSFLLRTGLCTSHLFDNVSSSHEIAVHLCSMSQKSRSPSYFYVTSLHMKPVFLCGLCLASFIYLVHLSRSVSEHFVTISTSLVLNEDRCIWQSIVLRSYFSRSEVLSTHVASLDLAHFQK